MSLDCVFVCLRPINAKMAEPIWPKVVNTLYLNPGRLKVYGWSNFKFDRKTLLTLIISENAQI